MAAEVSGIRTRALRLPRMLPEPATIGVCAPSGRVDEATYANMSPGQKLDYARSFDQRQFQR